MLMLSTIRAPRLASGNTCRHEQDGKYVKKNNSSRGVSIDSPGPADRRYAVKSTQHKASAKAKLKTSAKAPAKKAPVKKTAQAAKLAVKKTVAKKPVAVKKPVAKKATPVKKVAPVKKTVAKKPASSPVGKKVVPVKKAVTTSSTASRQGQVSKTPVKTPPSAKKPSNAKTAPLSVTSATKSSPGKSASSSAKSAPVKAVAAPATADVAKKSPRAAKAMAMMPPPPGQSVASTTAKSSYGPIAIPSLPAVVPVVPVKDPKLVNNWKSKTADTISDAEIIAMPDEEYMNSLQMAFFRHKLVQLKTEILVNAGETTEHLREDTVIVPDPADRATIEEEHALELRTRDRERKLLKKIEQSIGRIDSGDYGYCDETGEPIGVGRLIARPTATLSLEAQQRRELKQKMFGD